jgi:hypothetical protein
LIKREQPQPLTDSDLVPFGVTLAEVRSSLEFEVQSGRGPDSPERLAQKEDERREMIRLAEERRARPDPYQPSGRKGGVR